MSGEGHAAPLAGWIDAEVAEELPGLGLLHTEVQVRRRGPLTGAPPPDVVSRLRELSDRVRGARAIGIRREPVAGAYRILYRHLGLDPDVHRTPIEQAILERMLRGGFPSAGMLADILTIALLDTGVPVQALDASGLSGALGIRLSREAEPLGLDPAAPLLPQGRLVVADARQALAVLFGDPAPSHAPRAETPRLALFAVLAPGVPGLFAEEALWSCASALSVP